MSGERFLWNKDRTEMVRVGAIKQIAIAEIGGSHAPVAPERLPKKRLPGADKTTWVVRVHFIHSSETMVLGIFDSLEEARGFTEELQRHAEGSSDRESLPRHEERSSVASGCSDYGKSAQDDAEPQ